MLHQDAENSTTTALEVARKITRQITWPRLYNFARRMGLLESSGAADMEHGEATLHSPRSPPSWPKRSGEWLYPAVWLAAGKERKGVKTCMRTLLQIV
jgi:hypothetical protein